MNDKPIISWRAAGVSLGLLLTLATYLVSPLGVSTQFVVTDAIALHSISPEMAEGNTYLAKYGTKQDWGVGYGWMLVFGMLIGAAVTSRVLGHKQPAQDKGSMPQLWATRFGPSQIKRLSAAFVGGLLLLFGARLAGGCTSGHMISGISQLAVGSFVFGIVTFSVAILTAKFLFRQRGN